MARSAVGVGARLNAAIVGVVRCDQVGGTQHIAASAAIPVSRTWGQSGVYYTPKVDVSPDV